MKTRPMTRTNLDKAIARLAGNDPRRTLELRLSMANAIVGQFIADGVVKGGTSLRFRYGGARTRYTMDLDTAWRSSLDDFLRTLRGRLAEGWEGFTGEADILRPHAPAHVPFEYTMQPCEVKLRYMGRSWCTVKLEIGHNEIGDADACDIMGPPAELAEAFESLCLPPPAGTPLMRLPFQIAQKLHGATGTGSGRPHDLIDLQLIMAGDGDRLDLEEVREVCRRLFKYRKQQVWPPVVAKGPDWETAYATRRANLDVLPTVDEAVRWTNNLIATIENGGSKPPTGNQELGTRNQKP